MKPLTKNLAQHPHNLPPHSSTQPITQRPPNNIPHSCQQTIWSFIQQKLNLSGSPQQPIVLDPGPTPDTLLTPSNSVLTPLLTPLPPIVHPQSQQSYSTDCHMQTWHHQCPLSTDHSNEPWGDCWAMQQPTNLFCIISKNTGTLNLHNLDILAITKELMLLGTSVFTVQETNVHWNEETSLHLCSQ